MKKIFKIFLSALLIFCHLNLDAKVTYSGQTGEPISTTTIDVEVPVEISSTTLSTATTTVTFDSIPQTYDHLVLVIDARSNRAASDNDTLKMSFNNDTTVANYFYGEFFGDGVSSSGFASDADGFELGDLTAASSPSGDFSISYIKIPNYTDTNINGKAIAENGVRFNATQQREGQQMVSWESTAAITRIDLTCLNAQFAANSKFQLLGIGSQTLLSAASGSAINDEDWTINSSDLTAEKKAIIDITSSEALLVRKNNDGGDLLVVDTSSDLVTINTGFVVYSKTLQTTDATQTTAITVPVPTNGAVDVFARVVGVENDGSEGYGRDIFSTFRNASGTVTEVGTRTPLTRNDSAWDFDDIIDGTNIDFDVTGQAGKTINWFVVVEILTEA